MKIQTSTWKTLFELASAYRELAPWQWMSDQDLFGVKDPISGETGYCCVMGAGGEFYALGVYRGRKGLHSYEEILNTAYDSADSNPNRETALQQECMIVAFNDRQQLESQEYEIIRSLGLKFRGKKAWPSFNDHRPGWMPWVIEDEADGRFLIHALEQTMIVTQQLRDGAITLHHPQKPSENRMLVRTPSGDMQNPVWDNKWPEREPYEPEYEMAEADAKLLARTAAPLRRISRGVWLVEIVLMPSLIQEKRNQRGYFPNMMLVIDGNNGMILAHEIFEPGEMPSQLQHGLLKTVNQMQALPETLLTSNWKSYYLLQDIARALSVELAMDPDIKVIDEIMDSMMGFGFGG